MSGNALSGLWTNVQLGGSAVDTGYTPLTYGAISGDTYTICVANYQNYVFNHWADGSTNSCTTISPTQNVALEAYYNIGLTTTSTTMLPTANTTVVSTTTESTASTQTVTDTTASIETTMTRITITTSFTSTSISTAGTSHTTVETFITRTISSSNNYSKSTDSQVASTTVVSYTATIETTETSSTFVPKSQSLSSTSSSAGVLTMSSQTTLSQSTNSKPITLSRPSVSGSKAAGMKGYFNLGGIQMINSVCSIPIIVYEVALISGAPFLIRFAKRHSESGRNNSQCNNSRGWRW